MAVTSPFRLTTADPAFNPHEPVEINGALFIPANRQLPARKPVVKPTPRRALPAILDGPHGPEFGEQIARQVAQPDYARLGIDDPEGRN